MKLNLDCHVQEPEHKCRRLAPCPESESAPSRLNSEPVAGQRDFLAPGSQARRRNDGQLHSPCLGFAGFLQHGAAKKFEWSLKGDVAREFCVL